MGAQGGDTISGNLFYRRKFPFLDNVKRGDI